MLSGSDKQRNFKKNLQLAFTTAVAAGMVNVASVIAFFAFTSNITGHMAILAEEIVKTHWHQVFVVFSWLFLFFFGAFLSNFLIVSLSKKGSYVAHSAPVIVEIFLLMGVAFYGHRYYGETLSETEWLISVLICAMGMQNGLVATISNGVVKTTHLTGLFTDLGIEFALWLNPLHKHGAILHEKLILHLTIAFAYFLGGIVGGLLFLEIGFLTFYLVSLVLLVVLYYDLAKIVKYKSMKVQKDKKTGKTKLTEVGEGTHLNL